ncbi:MAG: NAD-dependent epimerase/dehydratase family protein [Planctomycetes bacterium]|nr:NAD-dependent epimerase/dehydratase family protein [Planctomycetota bacterium]
MTESPAFPPCPRDVDELEDQLSTPTERVVAALRDLPGDILILGVGGKMGPTLARMARRAGDAAGIRRRVIGVSRFSSADARDRLESWGVETIAADLLDEKALASLPDAENVVFMAGYKFGAAGNPSLTWAMNCHLPALVAQRFRHSRIAAFSSGNVYGVTPVDRGGSRESDIPAPVGEYAMSVLGRERILEHFSRTLGTPMTILRLNYAVELRYGVLVDLAKKIHDGESVDVTMGAVNVIWQAEANAMALASLAHAASPPWTVNLAGPEVLQVRDICHRLGELLNRPAMIDGAEAPDALLSDGRAAYPILGRPEMPIEQMLRWTAEWVQRGGETLQKPTHFEVRDGKF